MSLDRRMADNSRLRMPSTGLLNSTDCIMDCTGLGLEASDGESSQDPERPTVPALSTTIHHDGEANDTARHSLPAGHKCGARASWTSPPSRGYEMNVLWWHHQTRPKPIFCKRCGTKLVPDQFIIGYDEYTGKPIRPFVNRDTCTNQGCKTNQRGWA